jgi:Flp pilus assembly protein TadB
MTIALVFAAGAVWLSVRRRPASPPRRGMHAGSPGATLSRSAIHVQPGVLKSLGAGCVLIATIVLLGPLRGGLVGVLLAPVAVIAIDRLSSRANAQTDLDGVALTLDLLAAVLRRGQPLALALAICAPVADGWASPELTRVARLLQLGAEPVTAWKGLAAHPVLGVVAVTACRSAESGIRLASGFERVAADLRSQAKARGVAQAERAAVWAMAPLGLCFLPSFVCIGVIPVVAGVAHSAFTGLIR